jgi:ubiquinone/menaquinone biosynthesis C-methylase UbiE
VEARSIADETDAGRELRAHLHGMWSAVAGSWEEHAAYVDERGAGVCERMLELTAPQPGERVLELACGPGGPGLVAADLVAPGGEVVLSDVVPEMTAIAAARIEALGIGNARTLELDLEQIDQPDASYDVVLCREGLMLVPDPARAASEIRRVLRPDGRVAIAVWGPRERNPWLGLVLEAVSAQSACSGRQ